MTTTTEQKPATKFTMNGLQLLSTGQVTEKLVVGENLWLHSKVYSRGGENALHAHVHEDHAFFVLQGGVEFAFGDGSTQRAGKFEGIFIPKGSMYKFEAQGGENLVMLRMGGYEDTAKATNQQNIVDGAGGAMVANDTLQKGKTPAEKPTPIPGTFFNA